ncbi:MAG: hypothetical protein ACXVRV_07535 [Gaiellaceae bacterium]
MSEARSRSMEDSTSAERKEGRAKVGAAFTGTAPASGACTNDANPVTEKRLCAGTKKDGKPCGAYALGKAHGNAFHLCAGHAKLGGRHASGKALGPEGDRGKGLEQDARPAARVDVRSTVRDALVEIPAEDLKAYIRKAVLEGRDVRAITTLLDRVYADDAAHVEEPHTFDQLALLTREQRRTLLTQLEAEGRSDPLR